MTAVNSAGLRSASTELELPGALEERRLRNIVLNRMITNSSGSLPRGIGVLSNITNLAGGLSPDQNSSMANVISFRNSPSPFTLSTASGEL